MAKSVRAKTVRPPPLPGHVDDWYFRLFADATEDVIWFYQLNPERSLYVSPSWEKIWGLSIEETYKDPGLWFQSVFEEDRAKLRRALEEWFRSPDRGYSEEFRIRRPDGAVRWIHARGAFVLDDAKGGKLAGGTSEDITDRKLFEQERIELLSRLQETVRSRNEFLSMAAHELRTPLTPLKLSLHTLQLLSRKAIPAEHRERDSEKMITIALEQVRRLEVLITNLMDVSRMQGSRFQVSRAETNLSALMEQIVAAHRHWAESTGSELRSCIEPDIHGDFDRTRIEQVVVNLLSNALKYAAGAPIEISVHQLDGSAAIMVRDHGPGISTEFLPRLFESFARDPSSRGASGLGLGLYICRRIAEAHGGSIEARNAEGGGAQFRLLLPVRHRAEKMPA